MAPMADVAQHPRRDGAADGGSPGGRSDDPIHLPRAQGPTQPAAEDKLPVARSAAEGLQLFPDRRWQRHKAELASSANDNKLAGVAALLKIAPAQGTEF